MMTVVGSQGMREDQCALLSLETGRGKRQRNSPRDNEGPQEIISE